MSTTYTNRTVDDGELDPISDDFALLVDYLGDDLPPAQMRAVKNRLASEPAFLELALPLMMIRHCPLGPDDEAEFLAPVSAATEPAVVEAPVITLGKRTGLRRWLTPWMVLAEAMVLTGIITVLVPLNEQVQQFVRAGRDAAASVVMLSAARDPRSVALVNGASLILRPNGTITYDRHAPPSGMLHLVFWGRRPSRYAVTLNGSAAVAVPADVDPMDVVTTAGLITLEPDGVYELSSTQSPLRGRVNVLRGRAILVPNDPSVGSITLQRGDSGQLDEVHGVVRLTGLTEPADGERP